MSQEFVLSTSTSFRKLEPTHANVVASSCPTHRIYVSLPTSWGEIVTRTLACAHMLRPMHAHAKTRTQTHLNFHSHRCSRRSHAQPTP